MKALILALLLIATPVWAATFTLNWTDNSTNEDGFKIERKPKSQAEFVVPNQWFNAIVPANVTSYIDVIPDDNLPRCYRIYAFNSTGRSVYSNTGCSADVAVVPPDVPSDAVPNPPSNVTVTITVTVTP